MAVDYSKALKLAISSKEIYQDFKDSKKIKLSQWTEEADCISNKGTDTQLGIVANASEIIIIFRGSDSSEDLLTNLDIGQTRTEFDQKIIKGKIVQDREKIYPYTTKNESESLMHSGFVKSYLSVRDEIHDYIKNSNSSLITVTGHSLGGALATLCAVDIQYNFEQKISSVEAYTFGSPKVGNKGFRESYNKRVPNSYRFVNGMDIVAAVPRWWQGYHHVNQELRRGSRFGWNFISGRFTDHQIDKYINSLRS